MIPRKVLLIQLFRPKRQLAGIVDSISLFEERYCSVVAMMIQAASLHTTCAVGEKKAPWLAPTPATLQG